MEILIDPVLHENPVIMTGGLLVTDRDLERRYSNRGENPEIFEEFSSVSPILGRQGEIWKKPKKL